MALHVRAPCLVCNTAVSELFACFIPCTQVTCVTYWFSGTVQVKNASWMNGQSALCITGQNLMVLATHPSEVLATHPSEVLATQRPEVR